MIRLATLFDYIFGNYLGFLLAIYFYIFIFFLSVFDNVTNVSKKQVYGIGKYVKFY